MSKIMPPPQAPMTEPDTSGMTPKPHHSIAAAKTNRRG
jgi:hypothetical protein